MCTLLIPDDLLREAGLTEGDALLELACRLFETGRLSLPSAGRLAGLDRNGMEDALLTRGIAVYRPAAEDLIAELAILDHNGDDPRLSGAGRDGVR